MDKITCFKAYIRGRLGDELNAADMAYRISRAFGQF